MLIVVIWLDYAGDGGDLLVLANHSVIPVNLENHCQMLFDDADEFEFLFVLLFEDPDSEQISIGSYFAWFGLYSRACLAAIMSWMSSG